MPVCRIVMVLDGAHKLETLIILVATDVLELVRLTIQISFSRHE